MDLLPFTTRTALGVVQTAIRLPTPAYTFDHTRHYRLRSAA